MKKLVSIVLFSFILSGVSYSQSSYSVITNRVLLSVLVNNDTVLIENLKNKVRLNGELGILEVTYNNLDSRIVSGREDRELKSDITFMFWNEFEWLEERLKSDAQEVKFTDELLVVVQGEEEPIQANFTITRIRGGQGFISMIEIEGHFSPDALQYDFPDLMFKKDLQFKIILQVQVTN